MARPQLKWAHDRLKWSHCGCVEATRNVEDIDAFLDSVEAYRYVEERVVVNIGIPIIKEYTERSIQSHWTACAEHWGVKPDYRYFKLCADWETTHPVNPSSVYLQTWRIDVTKSYHSMLMGRVRETLTYGCFKPTQWIAFFCAIGLENSLEIRSIIGLANKANGIPYKIKRGDNSVIDEVSLFYNISNLVESLLNIANLRCSLSFRILDLYTSSIDNGVDVYSKNTIHLDALLDELILSYCVCPKVICKEIRGFLTLVTQRTFLHTNRSLRPENRTSEITYEDFDARELLLPFFLTETMQKEYSSGLETLVRYRMPKLASAIEVYMATSLVKTSPDDFVAFGSFLHSIMGLAGYGRALPSSSAAVQGEERSVDIHNISGAVEEAFVNMGRQAEEAGFSAPEGLSWIAASISYWKSTSAGVRPETIEVSIAGKKQEVKVRKKAAIGALLGRSGFSRAKLSSRTSISSLGSVGYRDVPYKPTRLIYVVPISTQYAQIAVASNIANYISTRGKNDGRYGAKIDPSHCTTGSGSTCGIRLFDNYDTIAASGNRRMLAIGTDLSSYDANLCYWNFRKGFTSALKTLNATKKFGPEDIPGPEMVDYAYGEGRVYKSYWDNGRTPVYIWDLPLDDPFTKSHSKYIAILKVGPDLSGLKPLPGTKFLHSGEYLAFDIALCLEEGTPVPWLYIRIVVLQDGSDLTFLRSEASGELTTLAANTVVNLEMQKKAIQWLHRTSMGKYIEVKYMKGVGDDAEWLCTLTGVPHSGSKIGS